MFLLVQQIASALRSVMIRDSALSADSLINVAVHDSHCAEVVGNIIDHVNFSLLRDLWIRFILDYGS